MKNSKICHVTSVHNWNDIRIFKKQCISLAKIFDDVSLVAPNAPEGIVDGVHVWGVNFPDIKNRKKRFFKLRKLIIQKAIDVDADIYQFHDPELLPFAKKLKKLGKKVIYDSHENVPATILTKDWLRYDWVKKILSKGYNKFEKSITKKCDAIISVLPNITNSFKHPLSETIYNYPIIESSQLLSKSYNDDEIFNIVYHGGLTKQRGIKEICLAINQLDRKNCKLHLMGAWESNEFENECMNIIEDKSKVINYGLLSFEECQLILKQGHLGLVLLHHSPNYLYSLPIKLYEYIINGMAVIMSDIPFWKEEFASVARFSDPFDTKNVVSLMENIIDNFEQNKSKIVEFQNLIISNQSWAGEEKKLVTFYKKIISKS